jgi:hypothetical protein
VLFDSSGKLEKMTIRAFREAKLDEPSELSQAPEDSYQVQVNPKSYTLHHRLQYNDERQAQGSSATDAVYTRTPPPTLDFEFLFDATGVIPQPSALSDVPLIGAIASALSPPEPFTVEGEIEKFKHVVYSFDGTHHRPRKVLLVWGPLELPCALSSLGFSYKLFKPDGTPLRAVANCSFREAVTEKERELRENRSSPDLTHLRRVREGDTLPLMANSIYGDPSLYLELARKNKLINFRRLRTGQRIQLPPIAKRGNASGRGGRA